ILLYRWFSAILKVLTIIRPDTLVRWHRAGFRGYWRWKSRRRGWRPPVETELRALVRRMSIENPLWGAPRIHGELHKLGFEVAQASTANCSSWGLRSRSPASPSTWSNGGDLPARDGEPSCVIMRQMLPPWTCLLSRRSVSTSSMHSSLFGWIAETSSGSKSPQVPPPNVSRLQ